MMHAKPPASPIPAELTDRQFEIAVRRLADNLAYGEDASPFTGSGVDYVQSRPFVDGDPVKDMDWRVTARTGRYHVKEYEAPKSMPIYLVVDTSASMQISSGALSKYALGLQVAGGLGLAGTRRHSPVGVVGGGERRVRFAPSLSRARIFQWLHALRHARYDERTFMADRLEEVGSLLHCRGLLVAISDLHAPDVVGAIKRQAQRHDCMVIQMQDPAEQGRLKGGLFRGVEAETGRLFTAHGRSKWLGADGGLPGAELKAAGIDHLLLRTDGPIAAPLRRFIRQRGGAWRNAR